MSILQNVTQVPEDCTIFCDVKTERVKSTVSNSTTYKTKHGQSPSKFTIGTSSVLQVSISIVIRTVSFRGLLTNPRFSRKRGLSFVPLTLVDEKFHNFSFDNGRSTTLLGPDTWGNQSEVIQESDRSVFFNVRLQVFFNLISFSGR